MASSGSSVSGGGRSRRQGIRSRCGCGDLVGSWTCWKSTHPGRRFVGCPNFRKKSCGYFFWIDPELPNQWYKDTMLNLYHHGGEIEEVHYPHVYQEPPHVYLEPPHVYQEPVVEAKHGEDEARKWKFGFFVCLVVILWLIVK